MQPAQISFIEEARATPNSTNSRMPTFSGSLESELYHILVNRADLSEALVEVTALLGRAFQSDGCLIAMPKPASPPVHFAGWLWQPCLADVTPLSVCPPPTVTALPIAPHPILIHHLDDAVPDTVDSGYRCLLELWRDGLTKTAENRAIAILGCVTPGFAGGMISVMRLPRKGSCFASESPCWTDAEIEGLQAVAHRVALVFSQLQLQQQLQRQLQFQAVLNQLTIETRNLPDLSKILKLATHQTAEVLQVQRGVLLRLKYWDPLLRSHSPGQRAPKVRLTSVCEWLDGVAQEAASETQPESFETQSVNSFWLSECSLCQQSFVTPNQLLDIVDYRQLPPEHAEGAAAFLQLPTYPALLLAPLESQGTVLGFLIFQSAQPRTWQPEEIQLVELVSAQVSTAIIQAETLHQVRALVDKRTAELRESLSVQAKLYERTRQQIDQLRHLNQLKDEFLSTVSHELRTPLTSMTMAIRMLRQVGLSGDRSAHYLNILEQQCAQETSLVNDLLALQELEAKKAAMLPEEIDLKVMLEDAAEVFRQKWSGKGLTLTLHLPKQGLRLHSDRSSLNRILLELLTNAGKYSDPGSRVSLEAQAQSGQMGRELTITLSNTGAGIIPEELPYIFDKFRRGQGVTQNAIQGTGLGLALVKSLVQHLNGCITATSQPNPDSASWNTCFTLRLPQVLSEAHSEVNGRLSRS